MDAEEKKALSIPSDALSSTHYPTYVQEGLKGIHGPIPEQWSITDEVLDKLPRQPQKVHWYLLLLQQVKTSEWKPRPRTVPPTPRARGKGFRQALATSLGIKYSTLSKRIREYPWLIQFISDREKELNPLAKKRLVDVDSKAQVKALKAQVKALNAQVKALKEVKDKQGSYQMAYTLLKTKKDAEVQYLTAARNEALDSLHEAHSELRQLRMELSKSQKDNKSLKQQLLELKRPVRRTRGGRPLITI